MNDIRTIKKITGDYDDYFLLQFYRQTDSYLKDILINFNPNHFYIYKSTGKQREVTIDEFLEFKYSGYMFFKKDKYNREHIDKWLEWFEDINMLGNLKYLAKPLPPFDPSKIIIKQ